MTPSEQKTPTPRTDLCTCCTCGHQWKRGRSGVHSCSVKLKAELAAKSAEVDKKVAEVEQWHADYQRHQNAQIEQLRADLAAANAARVFWKSKHDEQSAEVKAETIRKESLHNLADSVEKENDRLRAALAVRDEALKQVLPEWWLKEGDDQTKHDGQICGEITFGEVRQAMRALASSGSELLDRIQKAEKERDEARFSRDQLSEVCRAKGEQRDKLGKALERAPHGHDCKLGRPNKLKTGTVDFPCTCWKDAALTEWRSTIFPEPNTQTKTQ